MGSHVFHTFYYPAYSLPIYPVRTRGTAQTPHTTTFWRTWPGGFQVGLQQHPHSSPITVLAASSHPSLHPLLNHRCLISNSLLREMTRDKLQIFSLPRRIRGLCRLPIRLTVRTFQPHGCAPSLAAILTPPAVKNSCLLLWYVRHLSRHSPLFPTSLL